MRKLCKRCWKDKLFLSLSSLHGLFKGLDEPFNCAILGRMVWCCMNVSDAISTHKVSKFMCGELRTIIPYQLIWQAKQCKNASQDDNGLLHGGRTHPENLWPFRMSVNNKKEHPALERSCKSTCMRFHGSAGHTQECSDASCGALFTALHETQDLATDSMSVFIPGQHM